MNGLAACLTDEIGSLFPLLRKPQEYTKVILAGLRLKARNSRSARKRTDFLKAGQIKPHTFVQAYTKRCILTPIKNAERHTVICSARLKNLVFSYKVGFNALNTERRAMLDHAKHDAHVLTVMVKILRLAQGSGVVDVQKTMERGDLFHQVSTYENAYNELGKQGIPRQGYRWLGVRTTPVSHYYLSQQSSDMLTKCGEGR